MTDGICPFAEQKLGTTSQNPGYVDRVGFCDHAAGGFFNTMTPAFWNQMQTSTHFAIARDGRIAQFVNIFDTAWAQGRIPDDSKVSWAAYDTMDRHNPNTLLLSTEHEDWFIDQTGKARAVPGSEWTPAEYEADLRVKRWCIEEVKRVTGKDLLRFGLGSLAGHHMFDPRDRAECPGRFWRDEYRERLYNDLTGGDTMRVNLTDDGQNFVDYDEASGQVVIGTEGTLTAAFKKGKFSLELGGGKWAEWTFDANGQPVVQVVQY